MSRKIEIGCYAIVRGITPVQTVQVTSVHKLKGFPTLWGTSDGCEYQASELRRISEEAYNRLEDDFVTKEIMRWYDENNE